MKHPEQANPENNDRFKLTISDLNAPTKVHDDLHNDLGEFSEAQGDDEYLIQFKSLKKNQSANLLIPLYESPLLHGMASPA